MKEGDWDEALEGQDAAGQAKRKLLDKIVKSNVMQNVVPTLAALKNVLERAHSPMLGAMMACLTQV